MAESAKRVGVIGAATPEPERIIEYEPTPEELKQIARSGKRANRQLLLDTIALTGLSDRQFAVHELHINERTLRRYKDASSAIPEPILALLRARNRELVRIQTRKDRQGVPRQEQMEQLKEAYRKRGIPA